MRDAAVEGEEGESSGVGGVDGAQPAFDAAVAAKHVGRGREGSQAGGWGSDGGGRECKAAREAAFCGLLTAAGSASASDCPGR